MEADHWHLLALFLLLIAAANSVPMFASQVFGPSVPVDFGAVLNDGARVFGESKTWRGLALGIGSALLLAPALGVSIWVGAATGVAAMVGDLFSSFLKRRLGYPAHARAMGLDQIPECLLPLLALAAVFSLTFGDIFLVLGAFVGFEIVLSRLLFRLKLRDKPY